MASTPSVRVVVKLPYNRPANAPSDPPQIEWTPHKADILWKVIERSRLVDSPGVDWKALADHLEVPLPYLLYRVNARFQDELRGIQVIQGALSPVAQTPKNVDFPEVKPPTMAGRMLASSSSSSTKLVSPLGVRARLSSLGKGSPRPKKVTSSSTLTVQATNKSFAPLRPTSPSSPGDVDSSDEEAIKEEEAERTAEEEEALSRKLAELQRMMTNDALGLVSGSRPRDKGKGSDRGRSAPLSPRSAGSSRIDMLSSRSDTQSLSSTGGSPHGSIPDIPSPASGSQPQSPMGRNLSSKSSSPPALSSRNALGNAHRRYGPLVDRTSESSHGSEASSFSDLSDASISASALESALLSNLGTNGSRFSQFTTRMRPSNRTHSVVPQ